MTATRSETAHKLKPALAFRLAALLSARNKFALLSLAVILGFLAWAILASFQNSKNVTITRGGFETNRYRDETLLAALVTISNHTSSAIAFDTTYQIRDSFAWPSPASIKTWAQDQDTDSSPIPPFTARMIRVPVPAQMDRPSRIVVRCYDPYPEIITWQAYLRPFRNRNEYYFSTEQPANRTTPVATPSQEGGRK
ncbi:MAG: hypothetical protein K0Q55_3280 [Verrucomicrobia bacterium]|jgi:hypothetical protein|nr:hypothetical protein [Verrucomicrobiota bacterium]